MLNFDWILASISTILTLDCIEFLERTQGRKCDVEDLRCGFCRFTAGDIETNLHIENIENTGEAAEEEREEELEELETETIDSTSRDHSRERAIISENEATERDMRNSETRADAEERISLELGIDESLHEIVDEADAMALASSLASADAKATPPRPPKATPPRDPTAHAKGKARPAKAKAMPSTASLPPPKARASASTAETETRSAVKAKANATVGTVVVEEVEQGAVVIAIVIAIVTTIIP